MSGQVDVSHVAAGFDHSLALHTDGTVRAWGYNGDGERRRHHLRPLRPGDRERPEPHTGQGLSGVVELSGGRYHSLAVRTDGSVVAWGGNYYGEVGDGTLTNRTIPVAVTGATSGVVRVSAGGYHSVAFRTDGTVQAWGYNHYGQVGDGTTTDRTSPVTVPGLSQVFQVSAGGWHTLALDSSTSGAYRSGRTCRGLSGNAVTGEVRSRPRRAAGTGGGPRPAGPAGARRGRAGRSRRRRCPRPCRRAAAARRRRHRRCG